MITFAVGTFLALQRLGGFFREELFAHPQGSQQATSETITFCVDAASNVTLPQRSWSLLDRFDVTEQARTAIKR